MSTITIDTNTFDKDIQLSNVEGIRYNGDAHDADSPEYLDLVRYPIKSGSSNPRNRVKARLVVAAFDDDGTRLGDALFDGIVNVPVGMTTASRTSFLAKIASLGGNSTLMTALVEKRDVDQTA